MELAQWLEHLIGCEEVVGSNPQNPISTYWLQQIVYIEYLLCHISLTIMFLVNSLVLYPIGRKFESKDLHFFPFHLP